jgi:hypothetical protein
MSPEDLSKAPAFLAFQRQEDLHTRRTKRGNFAWADYYYSTFRRYDGNVHVREFKEKREMPAGRLAHSRKMSQAIVFFV